MLLLLLLPPAPPLPGLLLLLLLLPPLRPDETFPRFSANFAMNLACRDWSTGDSEEGASLDPGGRPARAQMMGSIPPTES